MPVVALLPGRLLLRPLRGQKPATEVVHRHQWVGCFPFGGRSGRGNILQKTPRPFRARFCENLQGPRELEPGHSGFGPTWFLAEPCGTRAFGQ